MLRHKENILLLVASLIARPCAECILANGRNAGVTVPPPYIL